MTRDISPHIERVLAGVAEWRAITQAAINYGLLCAALISTQKAFWRASRLAVKDMYNCYYRLSQKWQILPNWKIIYWSINKWLPSLFFANFTAAKDEKYFSIIRQFFLNILKPFSLSFKVLLHSFRVWCWKYVVFKNTYIHLL